MKKILEKLKKKGNKKLAKFQAKIIPTVSEKKILGVKTPDLRKLAKELVNDKDIGKFLKELPHKFFEENQLHAFIVSEIKEFEPCLRKVKEFLPFVDNWATCDQLSPKAFKKKKKHSSKK